MKILRRLFNFLRYRWYASRLAGPAILRRLAREKPNAFFVQIGANDGKMMDPLRKLILSTNWQGLAIEPVPHLFARLSENYARVGPRVRPVNVAIATEEAPLPFFHLAAPPGLPPLPPWAEGLGSFRRDVVLKHLERLPDIERYVNQITVPGLPWAALCERYGVTQLDALVMDTEGYDYEIIRQIDFRRWKPSLILYEHHHFSEQTRLDCQKLLKAAGYILFEEGLDTWCLHADAGAELIRTLHGAVPRSRFAVLQ